MASNSWTQTKIAIIGAGFGGLGMAVELRRTGEKNFLILEKHSDVGGVWRDNTYPGCTCDVPSHLYSFSFAPHNSHKQRYLPQQDILSYLRQVTDDNDLHQHLQFGFEVSEARFCPAQNDWEIMTASKQLIRADIVIFAVGQLHKSYYPEIPGLNDFGGQLIHSANWDPSIDLEGKRISIIGTGSSAAQMLPTLASVASELTIYQHAPHWVLPKPKADFGRVSQLLLRFPGAQNAYRSMLSHGADILLSPITRLDMWRSVVESYAKHNLRRQVGREDLIQELLPSYPIGSKRILFDNEFYSTLTLENVHLVTAPIDAISCRGIEVQNACIEADIIVCATGFKASEFIVPMKVYGRVGHSLNADWVKGAQAFMGLAVPGYPNLFMIAGPNTFNPAGSNPDMKELQIAYILKCIQWKSRIGAQAIELRQEAAKQHQVWLEEKMGKTVWPQSVNSWYKHESGRITNPWPESRRVFARMLRTMPQESFRAVGSCVY
ncbi:hypothetical protein OPT61_g1373 [Boeremia exigua]|uniref:Uncharacterized protein n=1 Tax=Boeremia exigua TaxID=749465 RepID=A0ACC2IQR1_9PLEO|nr:hypothetical protein OPT61_g1373 [Boeremia exigua]